MRSFPTSCLVRSVKSRVLLDGDRSSVTASAIFSEWLVPDVAPEIVERRGVEPATQAPEARGCGIHLRAIRGIDRGRIALDQAVVDVDVGGAGRDPDTGGTDVAVGDVNLAAVLRAHRVAVELEVAVVDVQQPWALAHDRLLGPPEWGGGGGAIAHAHRPAGGGGCGGGSLDGVPRPFLQHPSAPRRRGLRGRRRR